VKSVSVREITIFAIDVTESARLNYDEVDFESPGIVEVYRAEHPLAS